MRGLDQQRSGETLRMVLEEPAAGFLVGFGRLDLARQQRVDQRVFAGQRLTGFIADLARLKLQPLGFIDQQLADRQGLCGCGPSRFGAGGGMVLRLGGDVAHGDLAPADDHGIGAHAWIFRERTT